MNKIKRPRFEILILYPMLKKIEMDA